MINMDKNRDRDRYTFANINMLGKCNVDCFFCLGKDIECVLNKQNQMTTHFGEWEHFSAFLEICARLGIKKVYLTGQNTDPLLYTHLPQLITHIQAHGFRCGIRTNGFLALRQMEAINLCRDEVGYSVHTLNPVTQKMILGRADVPNWEAIFNATQAPMRVSIVINRCNAHEFFDIMRFLAKFTNVRYVQVRRISTETRLALLEPDIRAYEELYTEVNKIFKSVGKFVKDADIFDIYNVQTTFWRTVKTSVNSVNYFTDGTISEEYFIIEGYMKQHGLTLNDVMPELKVK